jgi:toxin-antitoxin system PIN domain toxin
VIAVDTNVLVHAHRTESDLNAVALERLTELAEGLGQWAIPWQCIHEFIAVVTHPRIFDPPTPLERALAEVEAWLESPTLVLLSEGAGYWQSLRELLRGGRVLGSRVHDARIAAVCLASGARELWTLDRDFSRFPALATRNPLAVAP